MSQQQRRLTADRTRLSRQERQRGREVRRERAQRSQSRDRLTRIPSTLESVTAGSTVSRRGNAVLGPASSRLRIPEPVPDNREPVPDNWEQGLEPADDSIDSDDGEYEGQSQESQESQEENELEQHGDDEDLFADWGGAQRPIGHEVRNSQASILTITPGNTQSSSRIGYPGRRTPALVHISQNRFPSVVLSRSPAVLNSLATPAITPSHSEPTTPELESGGGERPSSRRNMAIGLERSILAKACSLMWDWTIFVNPFPDPITLTEEVHRCWNDARRELGFPNFADATPHSNDQASYP